MLSSRRHPLHAAGTAACVALSFVACNKDQQRHASHAVEGASPYLYVWAGPHAPDSAMTAAHGMASGSDFLAVLDANPASATYGKMLASRDAGVPGAMAHHIELSLPVGHPLFASDFDAGKIFLLDVSNPTSPRVVARIDSVPGFKQPHSFARLQNGNVLGAMQRGNGTVAGDPGGLVEFDPDGRIVRSASAADSTFFGARIRPNGVELLPTIDRVVTTSMPMDDERTADVVQVWRLSDLRLLHTIPIAAIPGDTGVIQPYDARVLPDGRSAMINTYFCGLYHLSALDSDHPRLELVHVIRNPRMEGCAVAAMVGHYWVIPAASGRSVVSLDVSDPTRPVEVSRLQTDAKFFPHWLSVDPSGSRIVVNGTDDSDSRVLIAHLNQTNGQLTWDEKFRDAGSPLRGVAVNGPIGAAPGTSHVMAHSAVFGPAKK